MVRKQVKGAMVPEAARREVHERDGWRCVAPKVDPDAGPCRDFSGNIITGTGYMRPGREITIEHVTPGGGRTGKRLGPSGKHEPENMATLCWGHHLGNGVTGMGGSIWALKNKWAMRTWLQNQYRSMRLA